jgi:hypothetical protein
MNRNILLIHHSVSKTTSDKINDYFEKLILENTKFKLISIDEKSMQEKVSVLSKLILNCDVIFILVSLEFQRNKGLMEMLNYAKDIKAKLYSLNFFSTYKPFGSLGAISVSSDKGVLQFDKENQFEKLMKDLVETIKGYKNYKKFDDEFVLRSITATVNLDHSSNEEPDVLISCHKNQLEIAELIKNSISSEERKCLIEDTSSTNLTCLKKSKALVVIISQDFESSFNCRALIECARSIDKKFVPVTVSREYKPVGWLGLAIAGKVFYRILNKEKAFIKKYDSTPMNDLKMAVLHALEPRSSDEERENAMIKSLEKEIEECKHILGNKWPPKKRVREVLEEKPVKVELSEPKATHEFFYTNYELTRMDFNSVPKELFDGNGVPIKHKFDCMISYQWAKQDVVRNIYMNLNMRNLNIWFDIWGNMQGNCNDSMSLAVECSKVIIVCLNDKYLTSENCKLEFKYSVYRGKPFIFILTEPNLKIESWLEPFYSEFPKFEIFNNEMCGLLHNGVPRLDVISQAIREIEQAQPDTNFELSSRVIELKNLLDDAMDDVAEMTNTQRFKECTRCKKKYEENNKSGCKKHRAYYLGGGGLMEGKWVCCSQQKENSIGCHDTDHIDQARVWFQDPDYGTYTWKPE